MLSTLSTELAAAPHPVRNQVLSTMQPADFERLRPFLQYVDLKKNKVIFEANRPADSVYFLESGIVSRLAATPSDGPVEVAVVGRFGFVGISVVLGSMQALHRTVVLVPGTALRISADRLRTLMDEYPSIRSHLLRYVQILIGLKAQLALCNARHNIDQRVARWLLLARDRMETDELPVTHDFIARALGVRRPGVSDALSELEAAGAIVKLRGSIRIARREFLIGRVCECYRIIDEKYAAMGRLPHFPHLTCDAA